MADIFDQNLENPTNPTFSDKDIRNEINEIIDNDCCLKLLTANDGCAVADQKKKTVPPSGSPTTGACYLPVARQPKPERPKVNRAPLRAGSHTKCKQLSGVESTVCRASSANTANIERTAQVLFMAWRLDPAIDSCTSHIRNTLT